MSRLRHLVWPGLLGLLGALTFALPAQADLKATCVIDGVVKTYDKNLWPIKVKKPVPITGGTGRYQFTDTNIACIGTAKSMVPETVSLDITATGWYDNTLCACGGSKIYGDPNGINVHVQIGGSKDYAAAIEDEKYKVILTAPGHGDFFWHEWAKPKMLDPKGVVGDPNPDDDKEPEGKDWQLAGQIGLSPEEDPEKPLEPLNLFRNTCVNAFKVTGVIHFDPRVE